MFVKSIHIFTQILSVIRLIGQKRPKRSQLVAIVLYVLPPEFEKGF